MPIKISASRGSRVPGRGERRAFVSELVKSYEEAFMGGGDVASVNTGDCATILSLIRKQYREVLNAEMTGAYIAYVHFDRMEPTHFGEGDFTVDVRLKEGIPPRSVEVYHIEDGEEVRIMHALWPEQKKPEYDSEGHTLTAWEYVNAPALRSNDVFFNPPAIHYRPPAPTYSYSVSWDGTLGSVNRIPESDTWELLEGDAVERLEEINRDLAADTNSGDDE